MRRNSYWLRATAVRRLSLTRLATTDSRFCSPFQGSLDPPQGPGEPGARLSFRFANETTLACLLAAGLSAISSCGASIPRATSPHNDAIAAAPSDWASESSEANALASQPAESHSSRVLLGKATYYADSLAGNKTASGVRYDPRAYTAAHRTLPFGTVVRVRRVDNGASVTVKITDRGPFAGRERIIDLSRAAAESLGMIREGVVDVQVEVIE